MKVLRCLAVSVLLLLPALTPSTVLALDNGSGWRAVSEGRLTVRFRGPSDVLAIQVLERAGIFLEDTSQFLGLPWLNPYVIVIAGSRDEFVKLQPTVVPAPEWAGALTYPELGMVLIMTPGSMETGGIRYWSLLQHEMAHLLLGDAESRYGTRFPRWFHEGIATYVSGEMNLSRLIQLGWAQATGDTPDFRDLEYTFPEQPSRAGAAYARSYLFIKYLSRRFGEDAVARLIADSLAKGGLGRGVGSAFNMSLAELLKGFDQYARVKATWIPVITSTATIWGVITFLFFVTWYRKKIQGLRTIQRWDLEEEEERLAASLHRRSVHEKRSHEEKRTLH